MLLAMGMLSLVFAFPGILAWCPKIEFRTLSVLVQLVTLNMYFLAYELLLLRLFQISLI